MKRRSNARCLLDGMAGRLGEDGLQLLLEEILQLHEGPANMRKLLRVLRDDRSGHDVQGLPHAKETKPNSAQGSKNSGSRRVGFPAQEFDHLC